MVIFSLHEKYWGDSMAGTTDRNQNTLLRIIFNNKIAPICNGLDYGN